MPEAGIRRARPEDIPAITDIYNEAVATTTATFDTEPRSLEDRMAWFRAHGPRHAVLVADRDDRVVAWAALSPFSDRLAYAETGECHVYVASPEPGQGLGTALVRALLAEGRRAGFHAVLARIASGNDASMRLHESLGFQRVGTLREVGTKFGRRLDVHILEYVYPDSPAA